MFKNITVFFSLLFVTFFITLFITSLRFTVNFSSGRGVVGSLVRNESTLLIDEHVNVPDGGLQEATYTYLRPSYRGQSGDYRCVAKNSLGEASVDFRIEVE